MTTPRRAGGTGYHDFDRSPYGSRSRLTKENMAELQGGLLHSAERELGESSRPLSEAVRLKQLPGYHGFDRNKHEKLRGEPDDDFESTRCLWDKSKIVAEGWVIAQSKYADSRSSNAASHPPNKTEPPSSSSVNPPDPPVITLAETKKSLYFLLKALALLGREGRRILDGEDIYVSGREVLYRGGSFPLVDLESRVFWEARRERLDYTYLALYRAKRDSPSRLSSDEVSPAKGLIAQRSCFPTGDKVLDKERDSKTTAKLPECLDRGTATQTPNHTEDLPEAHIPADLPSRMSKRKTFPGTDTEWIANCEGDRPLRPSKRLRPQKSKPVKESSMEEKQTNDATLRRSIDEPIINATGNGASQGLIADLFGRSSSTTIGLATVVLASIFILPLINKILTPKMDPLEPPILKPSIPFIGHIIGIIRHQSDYHRLLHKANPSQFIVTLPMLNGKLYAIYDPYMVQSALRSKTASFEPFEEEFAQKTFGLSAETFAKITSNPTLISDFTDAIHQSFQTEPLHRMNMHFLQCITAKLGPISRGESVVDKTNAGRERLQGVEGGLEVDNLFLWVRDIMTLATTRALYGDRDPFNDDHSLVDQIWIFEEAIPYFLLSLWPSVTMPKSFQARQTLQATLGKYYNAIENLEAPPASTLVHNRAEVLRKYGYTGDEMAQSEVILPNVATLNAVPTFYWLMLFVFARPELLLRVQAEVEAAATIEYAVDGARSRVTLNIAGFDAKLPLLISCYRETMRLANHSVSVRRILEDLTITAANGQTYLLKKGVDLHLPAGVTHSQTATWGADVSDRGAHAQGGVHPIRRGAASMSRSELCVCRDLGVHGHVGAGI
ncbi:hypothetical protein G7046_g7780 [Stylonectria norvegica]|nr:hypothetical protein G7046_g7780 [Stylonectria norvegica]